MLPSIETIHQAYINSSTTVKKVVEDILATIKDKDAEINSYTEVFTNEALEQAEAIDAKLARGETIKVLEGIPISVKDAILIEGHKATASSRMLEDYTATYDATVIKKLKDAGAILLGKTNLDEFAMGASTENSAFGATRNPADTNKVPGGSSGGSAASVAGDMAVISIGSDTGGSIRQPASLTGIVGLKPTYGRVSRFGLIAMASSLDQIGPFAHRVIDTAHILQTIEGKDAMDGTSTQLDSSQLLDIDKIRQAEVRGMKVGIPKEYFIDGIDEDVRKAIDEVIATYKTLGVEFVEVSLPHTEYAVPTYYIIMPAEVSTNLARFDGIRYGLSELQNSQDLQEVYRASRAKGFGNEPLRRIMLGTYVLSSGYYSSYYGKAKQVQDMIRKDFTNVFQQVDAIITPTSPRTAFNIGEKVNDPVSMYLEDIFTVATNLAGIPGISVPTLSNSSLPIGFQLMTNHFQEQKLLTLAQAIDNIRYDSRNNK
ncbi:MAG: Asp-tRNA(Asn)/Glu-tRNA(Gln) amidotransferase subunit GatA [Candidatus Paceibacterota bacterium]